MDSDSDDSIEDILKTLGKSGMKIQGKPSKKIQYLEDIIIFKPDIELLQTINEIDPALIPVINCCNNESSISFDLPGPSNYSSSLTAKDYKNNEDVNVIPLCEDTTCSKIISISKNDTLTIHSSVIDATNSFDQPGSSNYKGIAVDEFRNNEVIPGMLLSKPTADSQIISISQNDTIPIHAECVNSSQITIISSAPNIVHTVPNDVSEIGEVVVPTPPTQQAGPVSTLQNASHSIRSRPNNDEQNSQTNQCSRTRNKRSAPEYWQKNITKQKRMHGESYSGYSRDSTKTISTGVSRPERVMGPACVSDYCEKTSTRSCSLFPEEVRNKIFKDFWKELDWDAKQSYACSLIEKIPVKQRKTESEISKRSQTLVYYLKLNGIKKQVCKKMFLNTLGLKERMVSNWILSESEVGIPLIETNREKSLRGKQKSTSIPNAQGITQIEHLNSFFEMIPKLPSHYCRSSTKKLYLEPVFKSKSHVYEVYTKKCNEDNIQAVSKTLFMNTFEALNLSIWKPKKDKCDVCCGYEVGTVTQQDYIAHNTKKKAARTEKESDKKLAIEGKATVLCMDVQSVKMCPKLEASAIYYKTKLCCHNYTIYNMATHEVMCYWWHECEGELQASNFASCLIDYITKKVPKTVPLIIYSDGCTAQNRNATMGNALLDLAIKEKMSITQKYLEKGHTQMECDSVHSVIETKLKNLDVYLPHQYATITKDAKKKLPKYEVLYLTHKFFMDYHNLQRYQSIRPGKKSGDPTVTDLRQINYDPNGIIKYKLRFSDELTELPARPKPTHHVLKRMYSSQIPLKQKKWKDLQDLKSVIPVDCHSFYDNLPADPNGHF